MTRNPKVASSSAKRSSRSATRRTSAKRSARSSKRNTAKRSSGSGSEPSLMERSFAELRATVEAFGQVLESYLPGVTVTVRPGKPRPDVQPVQRGRRKAGTKAKTKAASRTPAKRGRGRRRAA
jgi:hypothetical protein